MNNIIKTISDIHPEEYYVTSKQYKAIKNKKINVSFEIKDESIAQQLLMISFVKKEERRIHREHNEDDDDWSPIIEETGKYILTTEGEYYLDYRKSKDKTHRMNEIRAWITLAIAIAGLGLSIYSIYLNQFTNIK
mgnify:FL=1